MNVTSLMKNYWLIICARKSKVLHLQSLEISFLYEAVFKSLSFASIKLTFRHTVSLAFVPTEGGYFSGKLKSYNNITLPPQILEMTMKQFLRLLNSEGKQF